MSFGRPGVALRSGSEQLELQLFPRDPWNGVSPRALTKVGLSAIFKPQAQEHKRFFVDPDQLGLELAGEKAPRARSRGAPLLIPIKGVNRG